MTKTLLKVFVASFYKANAGFFLFFFFIFFGTVNGGSLISYHASLLTSILSSWQVLFCVFIFWILYEIKCLLFLLRILNSQEGSFLFNLQARSKLSQSIIYISLQLLLYAPVLAYSTVAICFGFSKGYMVTATTMILFQLLLITVSSFIIYDRMNNWLRPHFKFDIRLRLPKPFPSFLIYHFISKRKLLLIGLKFLSVILLYIVLVWNSGRNDNDSFLLFYLVILLAHFTVPYLAVEFFENELSFSRNLPLQKTKYALAYLLCYIIFLLPETGYLFLYGQSLLSSTTIISYYCVAIASMCLLTAVQYSESTDKNEYMKIGFALFFVSIFALHVEAFLAWVCIQFAIAVILFSSGFYKYESVE